MKRMRWMPLRGCLGAILLVAAACSKPGDADPQAGKTPERAPVAVETVRVKPVDWVETLELVGEIEAKYEAAVRSEYPGKIAEVFVTEWVAVEEGQPLARLDTRETQLLVQKAGADVAASKANVARAAAALERSTKDYERISQLRRDGVVSPQDLDKARMDRDGAVADLDSVRGKLGSDEELLRQNELRLAKSVLRAPLAGTVAQRRANVGDQAESYSIGEPMFRIVDTAHLNLVLTAPSAVLGQVVAGQALRFETDSVPGRRFEARVGQINPAADPASRSVKILAEVDNPDGVLRPGVFARARLEVGKRSGILRVPRQALLETGGRTGKADLFVVTGGDGASSATLAQRRSVELGKDMGDSVEILSGLAAGEQVVTRGGFLLRDADPVRIVPGGDAGLEKQVSATKKGD